MSNLRSRFIFNLTLLALLAIGVGITLYEPGKTPPAPSRTMAALKADDVTHITITRAGGEVVEFQKDKQRWLMRKPLAIAADNPRINTMLGFLALKTDTSFAITDIDLNRLDLAEPPVWLTLNDKRFGFGVTNPLNNARYILHEDRVYLMTDSAYHHLVADTGTYIYPHVLEEGWKPISIILPEFTLSQNDGKWILSPENAKISADAIVKFVNEWQWAQVMKVVVAPATAPSQEYVTLTFAEQAPVRFSIQKTEPTLVLYRADLGLEYHLSGEMTAHLLRLE